MIIVSCKEETYRYNSFHLVKAFFPFAEVVSSLKPEQDKLICIMQGESILAAVYTSGSKNDAERQLYAQLSKLTGTDLPWGILTGVRPVKPAMTALRSGIPEDIFCRSFHENRLVSCQKAHLAWDIASREKEVIDHIEHESDCLIGQTYSLYIGIPFCLSICSYCSFSAGSMKEWGGIVDKYLDALCYEIRLKAEKLQKGQLAVQNKNDEMLIGQQSINPAPVSVYIGGGTPTSLNAAQLERLFKCLKEAFHPEKSFEYTLEAGRPDSITAEKLDLAGEYGVSRISINPQTMQQETLDLVGRGHTVEQVYDAFELARNAGFSNINMDLIAGLPREGCSEMDDTLSQIRTLMPDSLTVHALAIKRAAAMDSQSVDGQTVNDMITMAGQAAASMGLSPYYLYRQKGIAGNLENIGYARPGCEGIYNILMMEELQSIIGCGAGCKSKLLLEHPVPDPKRGGSHMTSILHYSNPKAPDAYIKKFC